MVSSDKWQHTCHSHGATMPKKKFFQRTGFDKSKTYFGGTNYHPYMMVLGQGNKAAPPLWIQLSVV
jgi:hypothetical protein